MSVNSGTYDDIRNECLDYGADLVVFDYRLEMSYIEDWQPGVIQWVGAQILQGDSECLSLVCIKAKCCNE